MHPKPNKNWIARTRDKHEVELIPVAIGRWRWMGRSVRHSNAISRDLHHYDEDQVCFDLWDRNGHWLESGEEHPFDIVYPQLA